MRLALPDPADPTRRWLEWTGDAVAATADRLLLPDSVTARAAALRREAGGDDRTGDAPR